MTTPVVLMRIKQLLSLNEKQGLKVFEDNVFKTMFIWT